MAIPMRITYSITAMPIWARAEIRMPTTARTSITRMTTPAMATEAPVPADAAPVTARIDGPRTITPATVPTM